ncbi:MAG: acetate kinase [Lachnospiraceae bacterium]|nr:acetate kinase [Lachnospiraceae bacterium]
MNILVINCGSSSLKYQLINSHSEEVLAKGLCERIGAKGSVLTHKTADGRKAEVTDPMPDHTVAVELVIAALTDTEYGCIQSLEEIGAVGHRIVHGGENFSEAVLITEDTIQAIEACSGLAPLHNPANLIGVRACQKVMKDVPMVAVFDTAFHQTMPEKAYMYGLPYEYYEKYKIRRYGFHGTSHQFVSEHAAEMLGKDIKDLKIIVCHLGNGASVTAVQGGKSVDTSMGLTPLEGLLMGTRCGDIDPAVVEFICKKENKTVEETLTLMNKKSGMLGLTGISSDARDVEAAVKEGNERAILTVTTFAYRVAKYIGAYTAAMNGVDAICFTAGLGENHRLLRQRVASYLGYLGAELDEVRNDVAGEDAIISTDSSKVALLVVPTNEELAIARETRKLVEK